MIEIIIIALGWVLVIAWMALLVSDDKGFKKGLFRVLSIVFFLFLFIGSFSWIMVYLVPTITKNKIVQIPVAILGFLLLCTIFGFGVGFLSSFRLKRKNDNSV